MQTKNQIQQLLASAGIWPNKRLGQNFLIDLNLMRLLIDSAQIRNDDIVLEVGCGTGSLTGELALHAGKVIAVEIDATLAKIAKSQLKDKENVEIINADILENKSTISRAVTEAIGQGRSSFSGRFLLIANLPYNIASPLMVNLITGPVTADGMYVTVQKEVAERMTANAGTDAYGTLSIFMSAAGKVKMMRLLKPTVFWPRPQVESAMISFTSSAEKLNDIYSIELFGEVVRLFMQHRRKMLKACTKFAAGRLAEIHNWNEIFDNSFIDSHLRPEQLKPENYIAIANLCTRQVKGVLRMKPNPQKLLFILAAVVSAAFLPTFCKSQKKDISVWPQEVKEIRYVSSADSTAQPALFYTPETKKPVPLLVGLHTWGGTYNQSLSIAYAKWCVEKKWAFIHPNFRGPNTNSQATGSELVAGDIISAVDYAKANANVNPNRVYLVGASGGGYTSLLIAARAAHIWAGVSAWVPITDLKAWYLEGKKGKHGYADDIVNSCGGHPGASAAVDLEYKNRSPVTWLKNAVNIPVDINAGIRDSGVPVSHSLNAFNLLALEKDRVSQGDIAYFVENAQVPSHLKKDPGRLYDPAYGEKQPLFRRKSQNVRVTIFDGGHEILFEPALTWLSKQKKQE